MQGIVIEVCNTIILKLKEECIKSPQKEDWGRIENEFWKIYNFPNCIGVLDGKHVVIIIYLFMKIYLFLLFCISIHLLTFELFLPCRNLHISFFPPCKN